MKNILSPPFWLALCMGVLLSCAAWGEVQTLPLPGNYSDFAFQPETGDVVALADTGEALLFRAADLKAGKAVPQKKVRVGSAPCSVFYKQYDNKKVFAVACLHDSHMFVIDATDFTLLKKVELSQSGVSNVTGSTNPADPFLYYNFDGGHDSVAGAVSLRDLQDCGMVFDHSQDCAISASGEIAYRRGPWSPSGFESLQRTNRLSEAKPSFTRLFYDHETTGAYLPDPFDRFTAAGTSIYSRSLEKEEARLDFIPYGFFHKRPVIVGLQAHDRFDGNREENKTNAWTLRTASYNTFTNIGKRVLLPRRGSKGTELPPDSGPWQGSFGEVVKRLRLFADDERERVILAYDDQLSFIPLSQFELPDEPLLMASLSNGPIEVGKENTFELKLLDQRVDVAVEDKPDGLQVRGTKFTWKPNLEQIGPATLLVTLKHKDIERSLAFDLPVVYPSVELPFAATALVVSADKKRAILWEGPAGHRLDEPTPAVPNKFRMALIELDTGKVLAERKLAEPMQSGVTAGDFAVLMAGDLAKCEVIRFDNLVREKLFSVNAPIQRGEVRGRSLLLQTAVGVEAFEIPSFKRTGTLSVPGAEGASSYSHMEGERAILTKSGVAARGILYGDDLKPVMILEAEELPALGDAPLPPQGRFSDGFAPRDQYDGIPAPFNPTGRGVSFRFTKAIPGSNTRVSLEMRSQTRQVPRATHTHRQEVEVSITASGDVDARQVLLRQEQLPDAQKPESQPLLTVASGEAFVVVGSQLFRWTPPSKEGNGNTAPPTFVQRQSSLALMGTGKTVLKHEVQGGKSPLRYSLLTMDEAVTIDEQTGQVTIDETKIKNDATKKLEELIVAANRGNEPLVQTLRSLAGAMSARAIEVLGRKPKGAPVAIPIRLMVTDANGESATLQYYVLAEVPSASLLERLKALDEERAKAAEKRPMKLPPGSGDPAGDDVAALRRRIESLETRLDLMTRQMNEVLNKLEQ